MYKYFLTSGNGPCGNLSWTYDRIGNRLSETRDALTDSYVYLPNSATPTPGNTATLDRIDLGTLGTRDYAFGPAGHLDQVVAGAVTTDYQHSPEGQLADLGALGARSTMTYDGRSFLRKAEKPAFSIFEDGFESANFDCWIIGGGVLEPGDEPLLGPGCFTPSPAVSTTATYGTEGMLYSLLRETGERYHVLYLSGRPVAQLKVPAAGAATFTYLTTDHLGTPVLATNQAGTSLWSGGFEPFGADYNGAQAAGVFLRFPGQWDDPAWAGVGAAGLSYNLNRWYERGTGRYERVDPLGLSGDINSYRYALARPNVYIDPQGLRVEMYCVPVGIGSEQLRRRLAGIAGAKHCFVRVKCDDCNEAFDYRLEVTDRDPATSRAVIPEGPPAYSPDPNAIPVTIFPRDQNDKACGNEKCVLAAYEAFRTAPLGFPYPGLGFALGPNSNVFAVFLLRQCGFKSVDLPRGVPPFTGNFGRKIGD